MSVSIVVVASSTMFLTQLDRARGRGARLDDQRAVAVDIADLADRELGLAGEHAGEVDLERHGLARVSPSSCSPRRCAAPRRAAGGNVIASAPAQPASADEQDEPRAPHVYMDGRT